MRTVRAVIAGRVTATVCPRGVSMCVVRKRPKSTRRAKADTLLHAASPSGAVRVTTTHDRGSSRMTFTVRNRLSSHFSASAIPSRPALKLAGVLSSSRRARLGGRSPAARQTCRQCQHRREPSASLPAPAPSTDGDRPSSPWQRLDGARASWAIARPAGTARSPAPAQPPRRADPQCRRSALDQGAASARFSPSSAYPQPQGRLPSPFRPDGHLEDPALHDRPTFAFTVRAEGFAALAALAACNFSPAAAQFRPPRRAPRFSVKGDRAKSCRIVMRPRSRPSGRVPATDRGKPHVGAHFPRHFQHLQALCAVPDPHEPAALVARLPALR